MARQRRRTSQTWNEEDRDQNTNQLFASARDQAAHELGRSDISIGSEENQHWVGLPLPSLALRYLFGSTAYPLSRIVQITGEEGSCKSSFLFEVMRWHHVFGGGSVFIENENKDSPELRKSILEWNQTWIERHQKVPSYALEDWQDALTKYVSIFTAQQDAPDGPGRTIPVCIGIDSIMATPPREMLRKMREEGHSSRNHPLAAMLISDYMRTMPDRLRDYPFSVVGTNHLKPSTDMMGRPIENIPGGKSVKFMETFEVTMKRSAKYDIDRKDEAGLRLDFICKKNSVGISRRRITAEIHWYWEQLSPTDWRQRSIWDWAAASTELLTSFAEAKGKKYMHDRIMEVCPVRVKSKTDKKVVCRPLGFTEDSPATYREFGQALEQHPEILEALYPILGVTKRYEFRPGVDLRETIAQINRDSQVSPNLYADSPDVRPLGPDGIVQE